MLNNDDCRTLAEIERHLQEDRALRRAFGHVGAESRVWARRGWLGLLLTSVVLMVAMAALGATTATVESAGLAAVAGAVLKFTSPRAGRRAYHGQVPGRRP
jgi:Protein of unknown function (DUF3040)